MHGFITVSGEKMSKSRGTGIDPLRYLSLGMNPEWLRYYIAAKLNGKVEDVDFNPDDFIARVNADLIGKYVNIASRAVKFLPMPASWCTATSPGWSPPGCVEQVEGTCTKPANTARPCARSWPSPTR